MANEIYGNLSNTVKSIFEFDAIYTKSSDVIDNRNNILIGRFIYFKADNSTTGTDRNYNGTIWQRIPDKAVGEGETATIETYYELIYDFKLTEVQELRNQMLNDYGCQAKFLGQMLGTPLVKGE